MEDLKDLNFKVPSHFQREFKIVATENGMKMKEWLRFCHEAGKAAVKLARSSKP